MDKKTTIAILHNIRSVYNVGSMFRTADAVGIDKIYLTGYTPTPDDQFGLPRRDIAKIALGAEKTVPWRYVGDIEIAIEKIKVEGFYIIALEQSENSVNYNDLDTEDKKVAIIVGNEVDGIDKKILEKCDVIAEIPMNGEKESLNVSVAFGIITFELRK